MSRKSPNFPTPEKINFLREASLQIRLVLRLMQDGRVNILVKLLPIFSLAYLLSPLDLAFGPIDDAGIVWLGLYMFIEFCPRAVVEEHRNELWNIVPDESHDPQKNAEIIDGEFIEKDEIESKQAEVKRMK